MSPLVPPRLIGRERESSVADAFLAAIDGPVAALVITGDAGMGKTLLWQRVVDAAVLTNAHVLVSHAVERELELPYTVLADVIGPLVERYGGALPGLQERALSVALLQAEPDDALSVRAIGTAVAGLLAEAAASTSVLIALDDEAWVDAASRAALEFALRRLSSRVRLVLTRRAAEGDTVAGLESVLPLDSVTELSLRPLSAGALHDLLHDRLGTAPPRPILTRIADVSLGNPFAALELARSWAASDDHATAPSALDPLQVPTSLRSLVARRLQRLTSDDRLALAAIAAAEHPTVHLVESVLRPVPAGDRGSAEMAEALVARLRADRLVTSGDALGLSHPLVGEVLLEDLGPAGRRDLHARLAALVAEPDAKARHLALGASGPDELIATRVEEAANRIARRGAPLHAADLAAASAGLTPAGDAAGLARRRRLEARLRLALGDVARARDLAEAADRIAGAGSDRTPDAEAAELRANLAWADGRLGAARDALRDAIARTDDPVIGARIGARLVGLQVALGPGAVKPVAVAVLRVLDEASQPGVAGYVRINQFFGEVVSGGPADLDLLESGLRLEAAGLVDGPISSIPLLWLNAIDATAEARTRHELEDAWYRDRGEDGWRAERQSHRALTELRAGDWERAEREIEASCERIEAFEAPAAWPTPFGWRALIDAHRGRIDRARETLAPLIETADRAQNRQWAALLWSVAAFVEYAAGHARGADEAIIAMQQRFDEIGFREALGDRSEPFHVEVLLELGERGRAGSALERLERRGRAVPRPWIHLGLARARALVLAHDGQLDEAIEVVAAMDPLLAERLPFDAACNALVHGRLLRRAGRRLEAAAVLRSAIEVLDRLGAAPWARRARFELDRVGLRRGDPLALTPTERRIAELAASGLTNREVAAAAFVSPKTVEANLARAYTKLGIRSRAELGARMGPAGPREGPAQP